MFTGLVENTALVLKNYKTDGIHKLIIQSPFDAVNAGESIAVNGVCLTVLANEKPEELHFDLSPETLQLTTLASLAIGAEVNLERAMIATTRFGGHYVTGHVDMKVSVASLEPKGDCGQLIIKGFLQEHMQYLIPKGSVTLDGVSLTINEIHEQTINLMLVPHTLSQTTLKNLKPEQAVNIEFDYFTRIVMHKLQHIRDINLEVDL